MKVQASLLSLAIASTLAVAAAPADAAVSLKSAAIARADLLIGGNANLLRRWVHEAQLKPRSEVVRANVVDGTKAQEHKTVFVPVSLPTPTPPAQAPDIRIELRRGPTTVTVTWPAGAASDCAVWMRELLR